MDQNDVVPVDKPLAKWREVQVAAPPSPLPRHGHKAVAIKHYMIVFGGGNEGIVNELYVFNTHTNIWHKPVVRGEPMPGLAAFGMDTDGEKIYIFGGMIDPKKYSDQFYELDSRRWEYRNLRIRAPRNNDPSPCGRLGHTLNIDRDRIAYIFGGMARDEDGSVKYLDDLYMLDLAPNKPLTYEKIQAGQGPSPRESHTSTLYENDKQKFLFIYGGMNGDRLGDMWILDLVHLAWREIQPHGEIPRPRSLHSASLVGDRVFVFGGWVPVTPEDVPQDGSPYLDWRCSNDIHSFHVLNNRWESFQEAVTDEKNSFPNARAGHSACVINNRVYIWSGRDGIRRTGSSVKCCKDFYFLETQPPATPGPIQLAKATLDTIEITWARIPNADSYHVEVKKLGPDDQAQSQRRIMSQQNGQRIKRIHVPGSSPPTQPPNPRAIPYRQITPDGRVYTRPAGIAYRTPQSQPLPTSATYSNGHPPTPEKVQYQQSYAPQTLSTPYQPTQPTLEAQMPSNILEDPEPESSSVEQKLEDPADISLSDKPAPLLDPANISLESEKPQTAEQPPQDPGLSTNPPAEPSQNESQISGSETNPEEPAEPNPPESEAKPTASGFVEPRSTPEAFVSPALPPSEAAESPQISPQKPRQSEWCYVGQTVTPTFKVVEYFQETPEGQKSVKLESGFIYQFRVSAVNICGQSPWSDPVSYKTGVPGFPGAPSSIKISKGDNCAHLSWEPPTNPNGVIVEYSVYLAMKPNVGGENNSFLKVYSGTEPSCTVDGHYLDNALVDTTPKPAVIFRIAARNQKGYGPATQVRWLQENRMPAPMSIQLQHSQPHPSTYTRIAPSALPPPTYTKRVRIE
ncbi:unnamed protein product [Bursaphelenchus xylophilus]|uniref:(pine wood nematode) hypothetical protein n=1 Tax=Bursaphelenchus xylophilus TaxID=6326 RepID=A0A1I7RI98_BURXY|nr:unnamed protein product [Bursaphelenchus xylophilus]CAG9115060.1 unnamed protein product [Bursaphelenchus xylophilus]